MHVALLTTFLAQSAGGKATTTVVERELGDEFPEKRLVLPPLPHRVTGDPR